MKAERTIQRQMKRLFAIAQEDAMNRRQIEAYAMATALQWVLEKTDWSPLSIVDDITAHEERCK